MCFLIKVFFVTHWKNYNTVQYSYIIISNYYLVYINLNYYRPKDMSVDPWLLNVLSLHISFDSVNAEPQNENWCDNRNKTNSRCEGDSSFLHSLL